MFFIVTKNTINLFFTSKGMLLTHVQLTVYQDPQVLFYQAAIQLGGSQHVPVPGSVPPQVRDFALLTEFHEILVYKDTTLDNIFLSNQRIKKLDYKRQANSK